MPVDSVRTAGSAEESRVYTHEAINLILPEVRELIAANQLREIRQSLEDWHEVDLADLLEALEKPEERLTFFRAWERDEALALFEELEDEVKAGLLEDLTHRERLWLVNAMSPDERADLFAEIEPEERPKLMALLSPKARAEIHRLLEYPPDTAGGLMTTAYVAVRQDITCEEATAIVRKAAETAETIYTVYVITDTGVLVGVISLKTLILSRAGTPVSEAMETAVISVNVREDQEDVAYRLRTYDLTAIPVVDNEGHLMGIVTVDDVLDVIREESTEDIQKFGGMEALDEPYPKIAFGRMVKKRASWLSALFIGEMLTATAMAYFETEIARAVILALFVPLIISSGGNSGSQASTLVIRAMALGEVTLRDWWRIITRELATGVALGTILGTIGFLRIIIWQAVRPIYGTHFLLVASTVFCSLIGVVTFGTFAGSLLPFILRKLGFDPASASAPFVATLVDVTGIVIYFTVASLILSGTLLK